jgi:hypothetical protein
VPHPRHLVAGKKHILLDFDGPVREAFAGYGAANISRWRLYFSRHLAEDMDAHVRTEFALLGDQLRGGGTVPAH